MSTIVQLSPDLINKIAAGEVVERPASVVKELVENALDAGARRVEVVLEAGGRDLIRVSDDGRGMSREDAALAVERHATSKLRDLEGLFSIRSFGFRGEAVPAIASVSRMSLTTREQDALEGTRIEIEGGRMGAVESVGAPGGTTVEVRDLFFATPARRKFLKRQETEASHASEALVRLALARPDVSFTLRSGGRLLFQSPATTDPRERIAAAVGKEIFPHLLEVDHRLGSVQVRGFVGSPAYSAPTTRAIYTFVNGRYIRDRQLMHAIQRAYDGLLPAGRSPGLVLFIELPPNEVDVNVHPQKLEVRFSEPRLVYDALYRGISAAIAGGDWIREVPAAELETPSARRYRLAGSAPADFDWRARYQKLGAGAPPAALGPAAREGAAALWPREGDREAVLAPEHAAPLGAEPPGSGAEPAPGGAPDLRELQALRYIGPLGQAYLICETPAGDLAVLGLHAIRERLALAGLAAAVAEGSAQGAPFLFPLIVDPGLASGKVLAEELPLLERLGFDLEPFGGTNFALKAVPGPVVGADYEALLAALARRLEQAAPEEKEATALALLACVAAQVAKERLTEEEVRGLLAALDELDEAALPARCDHERLLVASVQLADLERASR